MKVALYCPAITRIRGGIERLASDLAWAFDSQGWATAIFTHNRGDVGAVEPVYKLPDSARVIPLNFRDTLEFGRELKSYLTSDRPDVMCVMDVVPAFWHFIRALKDLNIPLVLSEHFAPSISETNFRSPQVRREAFACADYIHLLLPQYIDSIDVEDQDRAEVIMNPVVPPIGVADVIADHKRKRFINVARIHFAQKGQDVLLAAFAKIAPLIPDWDLLCVGNAHNAEEAVKFNELVAQFGLQRRVFWNGGREHEELYDALRASQIFVLPSWFEGSPISLAEGLAHGLPAIGFEHCEGTNQLIVGGSNGLLAPGLGNPITLARAMQQLAMSPRLRAEYSLNALSVNELRSKPLLLREWIGLMKRAGQVSESRLSMLGRGYLRYDDAIITRLSGDRLLADVKAISVPGR